MDHAAHLAWSLTVVVALCAAGAASGDAISARARRVAVKTTQEVAVVNHLTPALSTPGRADGPREWVSEMRPITGEQTVLPVVARSTDARGATWLRVLLPGRPNSHAGWIAAAATSPAVLAWQIAISTSARRLAVFRGGRLVQTFKVVVGLSSTPTPTGRFFVEESVRLGHAAVGGPYALALSARSTVLQEFDGGPGQIAIHGRDNLGGILGTASSHGCIRMDAPAISWLAARIEPGTPVTITR